MYGFKIYGFSPVQTGHTTCTLAAAYIDIFISYFLFFQMNVDLLSSRFLWFNYLPVFSSHNAHR